LGPQLFRRKPAVDGKQILPFYNENVAYIVWGENLSGKHVSFKGLTKYRNRGTRTHQVGKTTSYGRICKGKKQQTVESILSLKKVSSLNIGFQNGDQSIAPKLMYTKYGHEEYISLLTTPISFPTHPILHLPHTHTHTCIH